MPVEEAQWFAMRDLTRPNAKMPAFRMLSERGFEVFRSEEHTSELQSQR